MTMTRQGASMSLWVRSLLYSTTTYVVIIHSALTHLSRRKQSRRFDGRSLADVLHPLLAEGRYGHALVGPDGRRNACAAAYLDERRGKEGARERGSKRGESVERASSSSRGAT